MAVIVFIATAWGARHGGINAFNLDLARAVASVGEPDLYVVCAVFDPTDTEIAEAAADRVQLVGLESGGDEFVKEHRAYELVERCRQLGQVAWWIGHDAVSGAAAVKAAALSSSRAAVLQHTNYPAYGPMKGTPGTGIVARIAAETSTLAAADELFGVGPKLTRAAQDRVRRQGRRVHMLIPGLATVETYPTSPGTFRAITFGRLDPVNDQIKQGRLAVHGFAKVVKDAGDIIGRDPQLTVIGVDPASPDGKHNEEIELRNLAAGVAGRAVAVIGHPFTEARASLFELLADSSVCLMLSVHEGFGLTGWEAISAEVPLVVSQNTGLYEFLATLGGPALGCVASIDVRSGSSQEPNAKDVDHVASALRAMALDWSGAKRNAHALRELLKDYTWERAARTFLDALGLEVRTPASRPADYRSSALPASNLPPSPDAFFGRQDLQKQCLDTLRGSAARLLTIVGTPGAGKTRLALEVARQLLDDFDGHGYLVDLSTVTDPDLVIATITRALSIDAADPLMEALREFFRGRRALIVLDNFEHVVGAAQRVADLLSAVPDLVVLATSRAPMNIGPEHLVELSPLTRDQAVELFHARTGGRYTPPAMEWAVRAICERLDCLPLAIELVSARARLFSPVDLIARLEESTVNLRGTRRDVPERLQSLRSAFDWSYRLLSPSSRTLFDQLSVFEGGWNLATAAAVAEDGHLTDQLIDDMTELVENRLLLEDPTAYGRYSMLVTLHEYAATQLAQHGEVAEQVRMRHARYFLSLAERRAEDFLTVSQEQALDDLALENANLAAALSRFVELRVVADAMRLARALGRYWWSRNYAEGRRHLAAVLAMTVPPDAPDALRVLHAEVLIVNGKLSIRQCQLQDAQQSFEQALEIGRRLKNTLIEANALGNLALIDMERADLESAEDRFQAALSILEQLGDESGVADSLDGLGTVATVKGNYGKAKEFFDQAIARYGVKPDRQSVAWVHNDLARLHLLTGDLEQATESAGHAIEVGEAEGDEGLTLWASNYLGLIHSSTGKFEESRSWHRASLRSATLLGNARPRVLALEGLATLAARIGNSRLAIALLAAADTQRGKMGIPRTAAEERLSSAALNAVAEADPAEREKAGRLGKSLTFDQVADLGRTV